jgi:hypothetical protein
MPRTSNTATFPAARGDRQSPSGRGKRQVRPSRLAGDAKQDPRSGRGHRLPTVPDHQPGIRRRAANIVHGIPVRSASTALVLPRLDAPGSIKVEFGDRSIATVAEGLIAAGVLTDAHWDGSLTDSISKALRLWGERLGLNDTELLRVNIGWGTALQNVPLFDGRIDIGADNSAWGGIFLEVLDDARVNPAKINYGIRCLQMEEIVPDAGKALAMFLQWYPHKFFEVHVPCEAMDCATEIFQDGDVEDEGEKYGSPDSFAESLPAWIYGPAFEERWSGDLAPLEKVLELIPPEIHPGCVMSPERELQLKLREIAQLCIALKAVDAPDNLVAPNENYTGLNSILYEKIPLVQCFYLNSSQDPCHYIYDYWHDSALSEDQLSIVAFNEWDLRLGLKSVQRAVMIMELACRALVIMDELYLLVHDPAPLAPLHLQIEVETPVRIRC